MRTTGKVIIWILIIGLLLFVLFSLFLKNKINAGKQEVSPLVQPDNLSQDSIYNDTFGTTQRTLIVMNSNNDGRGRVSNHH